MATDFWASSHYKRWIVDRDTLRQARAEDLAYVDDPAYIDFFNIFFANVIMKLGKRLNLRQRVIATATVFFKRFYLKNTLCETDPFTVIAACCYVAAKAEESPVHIKNVVAEARLLFSQQPYGLKYFASDNSKLAEMEFYLVGDLECDLTVFHPYRTLAALCRKAPPEAVGAEAGELGELGVGVVDGPKFWGPGPGDWQLELSEGALQLAWSVINDTYRSDLPMLYPPHLLAIAALYLALVLDGPTRESIDAQTSQTQETGTSQAHADSTPRRSSRQASQTSVRALSQSDENQDSSPIAFFASLNVSMPLIMSIAQEMVVLYKRMERYRDDSTASVPSASMTGAGMNIGVGTSVGGGGMNIAGVGGISMNMSMGMNMSGSGAIYVASQVQAHGSPFGSGISGGRRGVSGSDSRAGSRMGTPSGTPDVSGTDGGGGAVSSIGREGIVTAGMLMHVLMRMRENRLSDMAHPPTGRPVAVNKMLERTLAVG